MSFHVDDNPLNHCGIRIFRQLESITINENDCNS